MFRVTAVAETVCPLCKKGKEKTLLVVKCDQGTFNGPICNDHLIALIEARQAKPEAPGLFKAAE